ncbi:hypothetical protein PPYR_14667 [Photinus pyralis]|uniref:Rho-GAP domain-containing protein n=1 Tax=Photinus pyralis TaxID=7054 RepID=A0A5N4A620_PHOPY|nr:rac GTPase-activating protein 1-like [Photinus pyralis]KAB0792708.1 hypothetical protein PPYR_14667 [Photinus pyralis]
MHKKQYKTPKPSKMRATPATARETTDSGESSTSCSSESSRNNNGELSIVAEYDAMIRTYKQYISFLDVTEEFEDFIEQAKGINMQWLKTKNEVERLRMDNSKITEDYEAKLQVARRMLDQEKRRSRRLEDERDELGRKMDTAARLLFNKQNHLPDPLLRELNFLQREGSNANAMLDVGVPQLSAIQEVNTTGSLISDFSYSRSEDDLDTSVAFCNKLSSTMKSQRRSGEFVTEPPIKKRRSSNRVVEINAADTVRATTTLTVSRDGPITATSIIESVPPEAAKKVKDFRPSAPPAHFVNNNNSIASGSNINVRQHQFQSKIVMIPETCALCDKRIKFGRNVYKCVQCRTHCHPECRDQLPLPCVPNVNTPQKGALVTISDYTPTSSPMVPALIVHCMKEVESRGHNELGIYRIPGSEREVKSLKEKFLNGKGLPCLSQVDIHVICGTIKDFLRNLQEPLVTYSRRSDFIKAAEMANKNEAIPILNQIVSELPQPNRDTLAYVLLHLQRVSNMPECKMPADNLAKVFGPTLIGYSSSDCNSEQLLTETRQQFMVMDQLIGLSSDFWESFLESNGEFKTPMGKLQQTPSTDSLLYPRNKAGIFSPYYMKLGKRKQKFFPSPDKYL